MIGGTDPDRKMRRRWVMHFGCCNAKGGARCRLGRHWAGAAYRKRADRDRQFGRKPKETK